MTIQLALRYNTVPVDTTEIYQTAIPRKHLYPLQSWYLYTFHRLSSVTARVLALCISPERPTTKRTSSRYAYPTLYYISSKLLRGRARNAFRAQAHLAMVKTITLFSA